MEKPIITKEDALNNMRNSIRKLIKKDNKFYSLIADKYRDKIAGYSIYCREEEAKRWTSMAQYLIDSIVNTCDSSWLYEAWTIEQTATLMEEMDNNPDWDKIKIILETKDYSPNDLSEVSQLLLAYSPYGITFVEQIVMSHPDYHTMSSLKNAYNSEKARLAREEMKQRKMLGHQLVRCLSRHIKQKNER